MTPTIPIENWSDRELEEALNTSTPLDILREVVIEKWRRRSGYYES